MKQTGISLDKVNLYYSAVAFKERSLKSLIMGAISKRRDGQIRDIHALKNVSAEIGPGERVGLIGHNGAGKSTFLKMVAELYPISSGTRRIKGAVRSLFDLSMGFEPDATGRENILYRGLLIGMSPAYMRAIESEIVEFADIGEFIDYPIKTYSAGMLVRLAFAISTSVSGDILLVDEVIGAGDAAFIKKARNRITQLIDHSEILLLASHDFSSLQDLCERGLVMHHGEIVHDGPIAGAILQYKKINGLGV
jgi:lipopolysaccharide transport system ATP-binding protein